MQPPNGLQEPLGVHLRARLAADLQADAERGVRPDSQATLHLGDWAPVVHDWLISPAGQRVVAAVEQRQAAGATVYPADVLRALTLVPPHAVRVLILGQDPYHGPGQAQGLAFSVPAGSRLPPSLRHILQEIERDLGTVSAAARSGDLQCWAAQGVLLLNTCLTVEDGAPASHARLGWEALTDAVVRHLAMQPGPLVALLWGAHAQAKASLLAPAAGPRLVLQANHPSPLSARRPPRPFLGCGHFSQARDFLAAHQPQTAALSW